MLQPVGFFREIFAEPLAGCVGPRLLARAGVDATAAGGHDGVERLQRGEALAGVILMKGSEILRLAIGFIHHAGVDGLVGWLRE